MALRALQPGFTTPAPEPARTQLSKWRSPTAAFSRPGVRRRAALGPSADGPHNLNNPINALSGLPLRDELLQRGYRRCLAGLMDETLAELAMAGIQPAQLAAVPAAKLPGILRLPTPLFRVVAARMLRIDAKAPSSMADDLALGRRTEIDALCDEVVRLANANGSKAPRNAKMVELLEAWPERKERWAARHLVAELGL